MGWLGYHAVSGLWQSLYDAKICMVFLSHSGQQTSVFWHHVDYKIREAWCSIICIFSFIMGWVILFVLRLNWQLFYLHLYSFSNTVQAIEEHFSKTHSALLAAPHFWKSGNTAPPPPPPGYTPDSVTICFIIRLYFFIFLSFFFFFWYKLSVLRVFKRFKNWNIVKNFPSTSTAMKTKTWLSQNGLNECIWEKHSSIVYNDSN